MTIPGKGRLKFEYDYKNRLTKVFDSDDSPVARLSAGCRVAKLTYTSAGKSIAIRMLPQVLATCMMAGRSWKSGTGKIIIKCCVNMSMPEEMVFQALTTISR